MFANPMELAKAIAFEDIVMTSNIVYIYIYIYICDGYVYGGKLCFVNFALDVVIIHCVIVFGRRM